MSRTQLLFSWLLVAFASTSWAQERANGAAADVEMPVHRYKVGPGDVLLISAGPGAARNEAVVRTEQIGPDGRISFDLIGSVEVAGMTTDQIDSLFTARLADYIIDVEVSVSVAEFNAKRVFVLGEVGRPGKYVINKRMTILDAIAEAGSPTLSASKTRVKLFRAHSTSEEAQVLDIDLRALMQKGELDKNLVLGDGDVIYVPADRLSAFGRLADKIFKPMRPLFVIGFVLGFWSLRNF